MADTGITLGIDAPLKPLRAAERQHTHPTGSRGAGPAAYPISQSLLLFLVAVTLARLFAAAAIPLTEDEAYYRLWAQHLQFGYYDHPPMIAWWIWIGEHIIGDTSLGVRLIPILACAGTSLAIVDLAMTLGADAIVARRAAFWFQAMPIIALGGLLATPDSPATFLWCLTLCCVARVSDAGGAKWWIAAGASLGCASLAKYSALFLLPGVLGWIVVNRRISMLRTPWPWLALALAAAIFSSNIIWNAGHHWITFVKQFGRIAPAKFAPQYVIELLVSQILLLSPFLVPLVWKGLTSRGKTWPPNSLRRSLLIATTAPFAAYLVFHALHARVQAHWPAPLYAGLAILAAASAGSVRNSLLIRARQIALPFGLAAGVIGLVHLAMPVTDLLGTNDPAAMIRGWSPFAKQLETLRVSDHAGWIGTSAYSTAAELNDQPSLGVPVAQLAERDRYSSTDRSWRADLSKPGLVVDLKRRLDVRELKSCFDIVEPLPALVRGSLTGAHALYAIYYVFGARRNLLANGCAVH